jgi:hypothetical protein
MKQKFLEWKDNIHDWMVFAIEEVLDPATLAVLGMGLFVVIVFIVAGLVSCFVK